jgi:superkiller protein 3
MMGLAYERLGKLEEAEAVALNYLKLYPNDADAHALYGEVLCSKEKYDEAVVEYNKAIELDPMESYHYCKLAINLFISDHKNLNQSIELVLHALELNPNNAIFHSYLSEQYINAGRLDDAQNECLKALELGPDIAIVRSQYGKLQMLFQNFDEAEEHIRE